MLRCRLCGDDKSDAEFRWVSSRYHDICQTCERLMTDELQVCSGCGTVWPLTDEHYDMRLPGLRCRTCRRCQQVERERQEDLLAGRHRVRSNPSRRPRSGDCPGCSGLAHRRPVGGECPQCGEPYRALPPLPRPHELDQPSRWVW